MLKLKNLLLAIVLIVGGCMVIGEAFGPHAYWFNAIYFMFILPGCVCLSDWGKTMRPDLYYGGKRTTKTNDFKS